MMLDVTSASVNNTDDGEQIHKQELGYILSRDFSVNIHFNSFHIYNSTPQRQSCNLFSNISELLVIYTELWKFNIALASIYSHKKC